MLRLLWPTPRSEGFAAGSHRGNPDSLHSAVKLWPSPIAGDATGGRTSKGKDRPNEGGLSSSVGGTLSATWVEALMGCPTGWTDV